MNANPKQATKLMKVNKYFIQEKRHFVNYGNRAFLYQYLVHFNNSKYYKIHELPNNLGISGTLTIGHEIHLSQLIPKIAICDLKRLILNSQKVFFEDFKFLTSSENLKELELHSSIIYYKNGEIVPYEIILDSIPSLFSLQMDYDPKRKMPEAFIKKIFASNLAKLSLRSLSANFGFEEFLTLVAKEKPKLDISLDFKNGHLVRQRINEYIETLCTTGLTESCPPNFKSGCNTVALKKLRNAYRQRNH
uniref:Uncharacterized protein n=1 Tax=Panagrolaimus sp. PS1159 TaxID=55785 RepID=A0AC35FZS6_9BILA